MVRYLLLVFDDPAELERLDEADKDALVPAYRAFTESIARTGNLRAADALAAPTTATTIRLRGGTRTLSDGPFAETRERLVGYYLVEARDLDEAIDLAERVPSARFGAVEVRPVLPCAR